MQPNEAMEIIDPEAIDRLRRLGGDAFVEKMKDTFLRFASEKVQEARAALADGDASIVSGVGHALKSSAANVGALRLQRAALDVEQEAKSGATDALGECVDRLETAFEEVREELSRPAEGD